MATYLTEEQKKRVIDKINNDRKIAMAERQQAQIEANRKFEEYTRNNGVKDTNTHTFTMGNFLKAKKENSSKEGFRDFKRNNNLTFWDYFKTGIGSEKVSQENSKVNKENIVNRIREYRFNK